MLWLARSVLLSLMIGVAAYSIESAMRGRSIRTRWVWAAALLLSVLLPLATLVPRNAWPARLHSPTMLAALHETEVEEAVVADATSDGEPAVLNQAVAEALPAASRRGPLDPGWAWAVASLFFLLRYVHGWARLSRARRSWPRAHVVDDSVLISDRIGPAVVGLFRAHVVLPAWVMAATPERQRMILQHEREHVQARDHIMLALAPLLAILFPWNLVLWWQLRRLRLAVECDCDARVLRAGTGRAAYGAMLLDMATIRTGMNLGLAGLIEPRSLLQRRIETMKAGQFRKSLARVLVLQGTAATALVSALILSAPPSAPVQAQPTGQVQQSPRTGDLLYVVDGKVIGQRATLDAAALGVNVGRITVLSPAAARARYGVQGANGAVVIITRRQVQPFNPPVLKGPRATRDTVRTGADSIVVSGVPLDTTRVLARTFARGDSLGRVVPDSAVVML
ncbi:MAG: M56 family metallopeptidase, partial [Gemmatimonadota bacterium]